MSYANHVEMQAKIAQGIFDHRAGMDSGAFELLQERQRQGWRDVVTFIEEDMEEELETTCADCDTTLICPHCVAIVCQKCGVQAFTTTLHAVPPTAPDLSGAWAI